MKILLLSTWFPYPPDNGSKIRAKYLMQALAAKHDVTAIAFRPPLIHELNVDVTPSDKHPMIAVPDDPFRHVDAPRLIKYLSPSPLAFRPNRAMQAAVTSLASREWTAVVAVQMPVAQYALTVHAKARVIDVDTALTFQMRERYYTQKRPIARASTWVSWQKARRYETRLVKQFQAAAVVSQAEVASLQKMVDNHDCTVTMIPNGVDCCHNRPGQAIPRAGTLVYNGSLTYSANHDAVQWFLAEIYPRIKVHRPDVSLAVTGSTKGVDTAALALDDSVTLTGYVDDVRIPVSEAAACVVPIRQGGGTRLKILEAMALGTPVVATRKGAEGLDVVDGEHLLLADDAEDFACRTVELMSNADLRSRLAANARCLVEERYDWAAIGARFVSLVEEAVGKHA